MVVAFEGMDGSGKSTVASIVSQKVGFKHETQKLTSIMNINSNVFSKLVRCVRESNNSHMAFVFYTLRCMLDKDSIVDTIVERSIISMYFYENGKVSDNEFKWVVDNYNVLPDITFILYASSEERMKRIYNRNPMDSDLNSWEAMSEGYDIMYRCAEKFDIPCIIIDTEKYSLDEITNICSEIILEYKSLNDEEKKEYLNEKNRDLEKKYMQRKLIK